MRPEWGRWVRAPRRTEAYAYGRRTSRHSPNWKLNIKPLWFGSPQTRWINVQIISTLWFVGLNATVYKAMLGARMAFSLIYVVSCKHSHSWRYDRNRWPQSRTDAYLTMTPAFLFFACERHVSIASNRVSYCPVSGSLHWCYLKIYLKSQRFLGDKTCVFSLILFTFTWLGGDIGWVGRAEGGLRGWTLHTQHILRCHKYTFLFYISFFNHIHSKRTSTAEYSYNLWVLLNQAPINPSSRISRFHIFGEVARQGGRWSFLYTTTMTAWLKLEYTICLKDMVNHCRKGVLNLLL